MAPDPSAPFARDPAFMPSEHAQRAMRRADANRNTRNVLIFFVAVLAAACVVVVTVLALLRRAFMISVLAAALLFLVGCHGTDENRRKRVGVLLDEIALLGSMAQTPGDRSPEHVSAINEKTRSAQAHAKELSE